MCAAVYYAMKNELPSANVKVKVFGTDAMLGKFAVHVPYDGYQPTLTLVFESLGLISENMDDEIEFTPEIFTDNDAVRFASDLPCSRCFRRSTRVEPLQAEHVRDVQGPGGGKEL